MKKIEPKQDDYMIGGPSSMKPKKAPAQYPKIRFDLDVIPEAKKWEVSDASSKKGPTYTVTLEVKMIGISQSRFDKSAEFEIRGIEVGGDTSDGTRTAGDESSDEPEESDD